MRHGVDLGPVVLEVEHVRERQATADGRDAVVLDERHEGIGVAFHDREAVPGAAHVQVHDQGPDGPARGVDGHRRGVLAVDPDVPDVGVLPSGARVVTSWIASTTADQSSSGSCSAISPSRTVVIGRAAEATSVPFSSTSATLAFVVPTSMPSACVTCFPAPYAFGVGRSGHAPLLDRLRPLIGVPLRSCFRSYAFGVGRSGHAPLLDRLRPRWCAAPLMLPLLRLRRGPLGPRSAVRPAAPARGPAPLMLGRVVEAISGDRGRGGRGRGDRGRGGRARRRAASRAWRTRRVSRRRSRAPGSRPCP